MLFSKKCPTRGCNRTFVLSGKPSQNMTQICPGCGEKVGLADAKVLSEDTAAETAKEGK